MCDAALVQEKPGAKDDARHPKWQGGGCKRIVTLQETATQVCVCVFVHAFACFITQAEKLFLALFLSPVFKPCS